MYRTNVINSENYAKKNYNSVYKFSLERILCISDSIQMYSRYISLIITLLLARFSHQLILMIFNWNLSDSKSLQVSRTLLSILADLNSSNPLTNLLGSVPSAPIIIGITVTLMLHSLLALYHGPRTCLFFFIFFDFQSVICYIYWECTISMTEHIFLI